MLRAIAILLLGIILTSCASTKSTTTFKGDMPYVEGTPTHEYARQDYLTYLKNLDLNKPLTVDGIHQPSLGLSQNEDA